MFTNSVFLSVALGQRCAIRGTFQGCLEQCCTMANNVLQEGQMHRNTQSHQSGTNHLQTVPTKLKLSKMSWYAETLGVPFIGPKGRMDLTQPLKNNPTLPPQNFTLGIMQSGKCHCPGNRQTQNRPSDRQTEK